MSEIRMPKMGDGMEEGTILRWMKREGDAVTVDEPIAEIETDKANVEMPAEESGTLAKIIVHEGQTVPVGAVIGEMTTAGDSGKAPRAAADVPDRAPAEDAGASAEPAPPAPSPTPQAARPAESGPSEAGPSAERVKASPLARKMARDMGIDLAQVQGTGPGGQIRQRDIQAFQDRGGRASGLPSMPPEMPAASTTQPPRERQKAAAPSQAGRDEKMTRMRAAIARRTVASKQTAPHFYIVMAVDMDRSMALLEELNAPTPQNKITINDLIVKACAAALVANPAVNVSFLPEDGIRYYGAVNIGIAVVTDQGLTVPVLRDCGGRSLRQISAEAKAIINEARSGQLTPQEMSGGTFSVSNLGMFGVEEFAAIINPPESAILAVGAVLPEVTVGPDGGFVARKRMRITLSCDHRTVDGALGAKFLQEIRRLLESPLELLS